MARGSDGMQSRATEIAVLSESLSTRLSGEQIGCGFAIVRDKRAEIVFPWKQVIIYAFGLGSILLHAVT